MDWNDLEQAGPSIDAILNGRTGALFEEQLAHFRPEIGDDIDEWSDIESDTGWSDDFTLDD